jgi:hypothetical protein
MLPSYNPQRHFGWQGAVQLGIDPAAAPDDPSAPCPQYWAMAPHWTPIADVLGGTSLLRQKAEVYLPRLPQEDDRCWSTRIARSVLTPYYKRIVDAACGLILRKPIQLEGGNEEWWAEWRENADRQGTDLDEFARRLLFSSIAYGHSGVLVDYTAAPVRTLRDEMLRGEKPYLIHQEPMSILGWRHRASENGGKLQQLRLREWVQEADGRFGSKTVQQIRVLEPSAWEVWRPASANSTGWELHEKGTTSLSEIPFAACYSGREATLFSKPPMLELAHMNAAHFSLQAQLLNALAIAAQPLLVLRGWDDQSPEINVSVANAIAMPPEGGVEYCEPAHQSFDSIQKELEMLSEQMMQLGVATLSQEKTFQESGTAKSLDRIDTNSLLSVISRDLEQTLQQCVNWVSEYSGQEAPQVLIDRDYDNKVIDGNMMTSINTLFTSGLIDQETALKAIGRGEVFGDDFDVETIMANAEAEQLQSMEQELQKTEAQAQISKEYAPEKPVPGKPKPPKG